MKILKISSIFLLQKTANCDETLEIETFAHSVVVETTYTVFALIITLIINRVSKLSILRKCETLIISSKKKTY